MNEWIRVIDISIKIFMMSSLSLQLNLSKIQFIWLGSLEWRLEGLPVGVWIGYGSDRMAACLVGHIRSVCHDSIKPLFKVIYMVQTSLVAGTAPSDWRPRLLQDCSLQPGLVVSAAQQMIVMGCDVNLWNEWIKWVPMVPEHLLTVVFFQSSTQLSC